MLRRLGLLFAALALFSIAGGHWAVLQSVAWAGMLHHYAQKTGSVTLAVVQTFDGQHPCELCREIQVAKVKEQRQRPTAPVQKDDAKMKATVAPSVLPAFVHEVVEMAFVHAAPLDGPSRMDQPPTPPPRREAVAA